MISGNQNQNSSEKYFFITALLAAGLLSASLFYLFGLITQLGHNIPQISFASDYSTALFWALAIMVSIIMYPIPREETRAIMALWLARCVTTLAIMLVYEYTYGLDAYSYYQAAVSTYFDWETIEFGRGTPVIKGLSWALNNYLPLNNSYHALKLIYSFLGLIASFIFYRAFCIYYEKKNIKLLYLIGLFPSNLFWSSILGKDPVVYLGIAIYTFGVLSFFKRHNFFSLLYILIGVIIASYIRVWAALIMVTPFAISLLFTTRISNVKRFFYGSFIIGILSWSVQSFIMRFAIFSSEELVSQTASVATGWSHGGSAQAVEKFLSLSDIIKFAPIGMFTALFRPLPFEVSNLFGVIAGIENFVTLGFFLYAVKKWQMRNFRDPAIVWAMTFIFIWALFYGFVSYQNLGTAVRFKLQILPILLTLLMYISERKKNVLQAVKSD